MAILKFRVYYEEDDSVYRDIVIKHNQHFLELHHAILKAYDFDNKHEATFFRSNDNWQRGREITFEKYEKDYKVAPLMMSETTIGSEIKDPNQKFIFLYDFNRNWTFLIELINVSKEDNTKLEYPIMMKTESTGPSQYGTRGLVGDKLAEVEEKYDLNRSADGFTEVGEETGDLDLDEEIGPEEDTSLE